MNNFQEIREKINNIRIELGIEEKLLKKHKSKLKRININDIVKAQQVLNKSEKKIRQLKVKRTELEEKINNKLIKIKNVSSQERNGWLVIQKLIIYSFRWLSTSIRS